MSLIADTIKVAYKVLFSLQAEFAGGDLISSNIRAIPDPETIDLYTKYKILSKKQKGATVILIETEPEGADKGKPVMQLQNNALFRFQFKLDRSFLTETHLASYDFTDSVLYASNSANNVVATEILLSLPLQLYSAASTYDTGYLVKSGSKFYKAVQPSNGGNPHSVTETDFWKEIGDGFISQTDLRTRASFTNAVDLDTTIVVEIVHNGALSADYKLLDGSSKCREVIYKIKLHTYK